MNVDINLDSIQADLKIITELFIKFDEDLSTVYEKEFEVNLPKDVQVEGLVDDLEHLSGLLDELSIMVDGHNRGTYSVLEAVRAECEKRKVA